MAEKKSETPVVNGDRLAKVRGLLLEAVAELHAISQDPNSSRDTAFAAFDMYKSLRRFSAKL